MKAMECQERPDGLCKSLTGDGKIFGIGIRPLYVARAATYAMVSVVQYEDEPRDIGLDL